MTYYRLYCLDEDGKFIKAHDIHAASDEDALKQARELKLEVRCELWEHGRMVGELQPANPKN